MNTIQSLKSMQDLILYVEVTSIYGEILRYSTRTLNVTKDGQPIYIEPFISDSIDVSHECSFLLTEGSTSFSVSNSGFELIFTTAALADSIRFYGAEVKCHVGSTEYSAIEQFELFFTGIISNILLTDKGTHVTLSSSGLNLSKNVLETKDSQVVPLVIGHDSNFSARQVSINDINYYVVSSKPVTLISVRDSHGNDISYTQVSYLDWTVIQCTQPVDTNIVIEAEYGSGTLADLVRIICELNGIVVNENDLLALRAAYPEHVGIQLFEQVSYSELINVILHGTSYVWFIDFTTNELRLRKFGYNTPIAATLTDTHIIEDSFRMSYFTRPYTDFRVLYNLTWHDLKADQYKLESDHKASLPVSLHKAYPDIVFPTKSATVAAQVARNFADLYQDGLNVITVQISIVFGGMLVGDIVTIDSDILGIHSDFFVRSVYYSLRSHKITLNLITMKGS